jgi:predicted nucleotidyltransferase
MVIPKDILVQHPGLDDWCILSGYRGSISHGTYVNCIDPNSIDDKDVMAICIPPLDEHYFGLKQFGSRGTQEIKYREWDIVVYEVVKFIRMLQQGNPNVLCMLWLEPNHYIKVTPPGQLILDNRELFVGRHVYMPFIGYAHDQLHKMTHHAFHGHMGAKRKALVEKYGYDCKNAAHLIRLLRMGAEFLKDGRMNVLRHDATQLLEIKRGEWTLGQVLKEADRWFKLAEEAYLRSTLPVQPDNKLIVGLATDVLKLGLFGEYASCEPPIEEDEEEIQL